MHRLLLPWLAASLCAQLQPTTTPPRYSMLRPMQAVTVTFAQPVQPASIHAQSMRAFGKWSGVSPGVITLGPGNLSATFQPLWPWFVGEIVTITLTNAVTSASGQALQGGGYWPFRVQSAPGTRQFAAAQTISLRDPSGAPLGTYGIHAADVDADGAPDIVSMNELSHDLRVLRNNGCGSFGAITTYPDPGAWPSPNASADFDGDGYLDLATGNQYGGSVSVHSNDHLGGFLPATHWVTTGYVHGIATADFDGDGWPDLAATTQNDVCVLRNLGNGNFAVFGRYDLGTGEDSITVLDANEDGRPDLAVGCRDTNLVLLLGNGDGTFAQGAAVSTGGIPFHATAGDLDGDHHADVLVAIRAANACAVLRGNGTGTFAAPVLYAAGSHPASVDVADLDGDGALDVVVSNYSSANYTLWWNRGDGVLVAPQTLAASTSGSCCTMVDFDRDGILDLIGADETSDVAILYRQPLPPVAGVQAGSCTLRVRVDQWGYGAGFGTLPAMAVPQGATLALSLSGPDYGTAFLGLGAPLPVAQSLPGYGSISLDSQAPLWVAFVPLDARGEGLRRLTLPASGAVGWQFAVQGCLISPLTNLSNPQTFRIVP